MKPSGTEQDWPEPDTDHNGFEFPEFDDEDPYARFEFDTADELKADASDDDLFGEPAWDKYPLVSAKDLAGPIKPARWLVRGVWVEKSAGVVAGKKKAFKTWQMHAMALAVTGNKPFLDRFPVVTSGPVIYLTGEGGQDEFQSRHQAIARRYGFDAADMGHLPFHTLFKVSSLDDDEFLDAIKHHLDTVQPVVVYIDPLYAYHPHDVDVSSVYSRGQMLAAIRQEVEPYAALIIGDHLNKSANDTRLDLDDIGFSGMSQWADSWSLQRHREAFRTDAADSFAKLEVEFGSRRTGSMRYEIDWQLTRDTSDKSTIRWADCDWQVLDKVDTSKPITVASEEDTRKAIRLYITEGLRKVAAGDDSGFYSETEILKGTAAESGIPRSRVEKGLQSLIDEGVLQPSTAERVGRDGKSRKVKTWVFVREQ